MINLELLKNKIDNKEELASIQEFEECLNIYPYLAFQIPNALDLSLSLWKQSSLETKEKLAQIIEEYSFAELFNEKNNTPTKLKFSLKNGTLVCNLDYYKVKVNNETLDLLASNNLEGEMYLKLLNEEVSTFIELNKLEEFLDNSSRKALTISLGLSLLAVGVLNTNAIKNDIFSFDTKESHLKSIGDLRLSLAQDLERASDPQLKTLGAKLSNFDLEHFNLNLFDDVKPDHGMIEEMILSFYLEKNPSHIEDIKPFIPKIADAIIKHSQDKNIDYKIIMGIMKVESDFDQFKISTTKDYSLAQINYKIWAPELERVKKIKLDKNKLKTDIDYSVEMMCEILSIFKDRFEKDKMWYARYHSSTPGLKVKYGTKVNNAISSLKLEEYNYQQQQLKEIKTALLNLDESLLEDNNIEVAHIQSLLSKVEELEIKTNQYLAMK